MKPEYILCAAIHYDDGSVHEEQPRNIKTGIVVTGRRHHNCIITMAILMQKNWRTEIIPGGLKETQGFLTSHDRFLNRKEAWSFAIETGQIESNKKENMLFSEDLY